MKIGIFGDSYAANVFHPLINDDISYIEMLYRKYDLTNFGQSGSSLFYSYRLFCNNHKSYDKIIFLVNNHGRIYLNPNDHPNIDIPSLHIAGINNAERLLDINKNHSEKVKLFKAVIDYMLYVKNNEQDIVFHNLMLEDIKSKRPDAILIDTKYFFGPVDNDFKFWDIDPNDNIYSKYNDFRHCHLSKEKHIILYEMIEDCIKTGKLIDVNRLINVKPSKTFDQYFKYINKSFNYPLSPNEYKEIFI